MLSTKRHVTKSLASLATFSNLALMVALLAVTTALILISTTTQAQASNGTVPNLQLSSASPGELTIAWDAPDPAPSDYRVIWAEQSLDFLSYRLPNEANRGNEYPTGSERSITLTGLAKGKTFKVQARARYTSGGRNDGPWSGPWTDTVTTRVMDDPPAAPSGITAGQVAHDSVTLTWTAPSSGSTVTGYRVLRDGNGRRLPLHHCTGHREHHRGVHRLHRSAEDHVPLRGAGPQPGRGRGTIGRAQRYHAGRAFGKER